MGGVLLLNQCLAEPAIDKRLSNCYEDCQHGNQTKFLREKQSGQNDRDNNLDSLLAETFGPAPKKGTNDFFTYFFCQDVPGKEDLGNN